MIENLRNTSGIGFVIIAAFFWSSPSAGFAATPKAGFDCSKAASAMEKLICGDAKLAAADAELAAQFASVRDRFDPARRASLLNGQRIWLKLREQACPPEAFIAVGGVIGCLQSVYGERLRELHEQSLLQNDENANPQAPHVNLDTVLDAERDLAAYFPRDMSTMHHTVGDARVGERVPATCRELFTLTRGTWTYSSDNIGISSEQSAVSKCNFALAAAQKWPGVGPSTDEAMFEDVTNYSWEFGLLSGSTDYDGKDIRTFAQEQARWQDQDRAQECREPRRRRLPGGQHAGCLHR